MNASLSRGLLAAALAASVPCADAALDVAGLDKSIDACTDFYAYANDSWLAATTIPADRARWSTGEIIAQRNAKVLTDLLEKGIRELAGDKYKRGTPEWMALNYYRAGMDTNRIEYWSWSPVRPFLTAAQEVKTPADLARAFGQLQANGIGAGFDFDVGPDRKDSAQNLPEIAQGGIGLPDRDYYFREDEKSAKVREQYQQHVEKMFLLVQEPAEQAKAHAQAVFAIETELARASMTATERRDVDKTYNKMSVEELAKLAPGLPWGDYFTALGAKGIAEANISQPEFFKALARLATERPAAEWQAYLRWHVLHSAAEVLPRAFDEENFDFYQRKLNGVQEPLPRARRVIRVMGGWRGDVGVGMAVGKLYVGVAFPPEAKARAQVLVDNVKAALAERIRKNEWMSPDTRKASLEKLAAMQVKIGYPDKWRDYKGAEIGPGNYAENWLAANQFDVRRTLAKVGKPVDRSEWFLAPYVVNAYYNAQGNEIVFPAAILQPPYFDATADDALNYGGIGMVIGHEITHGFDNRGRRFDKDGNMRDWWTEEDAKRYATRAEVIERQYSAMKEVEGVKPNGKLTLGENISDIGGLKIAYDALQRALKGKPQPKIDGLTPDQRFFLSWVQGWRSKARPEYERNAVLTGQHSLPRFRIAGPLAHMPEFAKAFSCDASKTLLPEAKGNAIW